MDEEAKKLIKGFLDYFSGCDYQEQSEILYMINDVSQIPFIEIEEATFDDLEKELFEERLKE